MAKIRVAINGFGRIGRHVCRRALHSDHLEVVAINDIGEGAELAYLFSYDTVHGKYRGKVEFRNNQLIIDERTIAVSGYKEPAKLPWQRLDIDCVVEATGRFTTGEAAKSHLTAGAKRVVISAPATGVPTFVMGVNHEEYLPEQLIVSNASCTTNCLAPLAKIIHDEFGIEEGLMSTVHALTAAQSTVDSPARRDMRAGRAASYNIVPAATGAAQAVTLCLPALKDRLTGMAFRVPVLDVSVVDLTVRLAKKASYPQICQVIQKAAQGKLHGILGYTEQALVSSDFIGDTRSCIFDASASLQLNDTFVKLIAWYDNEVAYCQRVIDLISHMVASSKKTHSL